MTQAALPGAGEQQFHPVADLADLPPGLPVSRRLPTGIAIVLVNLGVEVCALADCCSHEELELSAGEVLPDGTIECAWHGARFDCRTGAVCAPPAYDPVPVYAVRVEGNTVLVGPQLVTP
jgi:3-phenylpropionate/trans-cinnamate dioxygenase ferredoxin subunit